MGKVMSYRPITISAPIYRSWAALRLKDLQEWVQHWGLEEMYAGIPGRGAMDAWHEALTEVEEMKMMNTDFCGGVADIMKFFDQIPRRIVYNLLAVAGIPKPILAAYAAFLEDLMVHNVLAGGVGTPYRRKCGIPQGCPFSMAVVAMLMRPWIIMMRTIPGVRCFILADDLLIMAKGMHMIRAAADALNCTHEFLKDMGARVAADKSFNFATTKEAREWMENTWWDHLNDVIPVVQDFRYVGAHLSTSQSCVSKTLEKGGRKPLHN